MHEEDLRFVKTLEDSGISEKIKSTTVDVRIDMSTFPRSERPNVLKRIEEQENWGVFQNGAVEAPKEKERTLRKPFGSSATPVPTFEDLEKETERLTPYQIRSKKEDIDLEIAEYEEAIGYLQESISEENQSKADSRFSGSRYYLEVKCSTYRTQTESFRNWDEHIARTKDRTTLMIAWCNRQKAVRAMFERKLKERKNPKAFQAIIKQAQELTSEHGRVSRKAKNITEKPIETLQNLPFKIVNAFMEDKMRMLLIENELSTLEHKFNWHDIPPETTFPSLGDDLTSGQLNYGSWVAHNNDALKVLDELYREGKKREEETKKA